MHQRDTSLHFLVWHAIICAEVPGSVLIVFKEKTSQMHQRKASSHFCFLALFWLTLPSVINAKKVASICNSLYWSPRVCSWRVQEKLLKCTREMICPSHFSLTCSTLSWWWLLVMCRLPVRFHRIGLHIDRGVLHKSELQQLLWPLQGFSRGSDVPIRTRNE